MSQKLRMIREGDIIEARGPLGRITYRGNGSFSIRRPAESSSRGNRDFDRRVTNVGMIAGGTGITPMMQVKPVCCVADIGMLPACS